MNNNPETRRYLPLNVDTVTDDAMKNAREEIAKAFGVPLHLLGSLDDAEKMRRARNAIDTVLMGHLDQWQRTLLEKYEQGDSAVARTAKSIAQLPNMFPK